MGILKTTNETHYHVSKAAAEEQRKAAEAQERAAWNATSGERALADAQEEAARQQRKADVEVAKEQRKRDVKVAKEHRKEVEAQLKHEKEMRLMDESPDAYRAYLAEEQRKRESREKWIKIGVIIFIGWFILGMVVAFLSK